MACNREPMLLGSSLDVPIEILRQDSVTSPCSLDDSVRGNIAVFVTSCLKSLAQHFLHVLILILVFVRYRDGGGLFSFHATSSRTSAALRRPRLPLMLPHAEGKSFSRRATSVLNQAMSSSVSTSNGFGLLKARSCALRPSVLTISRYSASRSSTISNRPYEPPFCGRQSPTPTMMPAAPSKF